MLECNYENRCKATILYVPFSKGLEENVFD